VDRRAVAPVAQAAPVAIVRKVDDRQCFRSVHRLSSKSDIDILLSSNPNAAATLFVRACVRRSRCVPNIDKWLQSAGLVASRRRPVPWRIHCASVARARDAKLMEILVMLIPLSVVLVFLIGAAFWWAVDDGQFDNSGSAAESILHDDDRAAGDH
jgi:cbb3-type cytochrome oxidase maturation protein